MVSDLRTERVETVPGGQVRDGSVSQSLPWSLMLPFGILPWLGEDHIAVSGDAVVSRLAGIQQEHFRLVDFEVLHPVFSIVSGVRSPDPRARAEQRGVRSQITRV